MKRFPKPVSGDGRNLPQRPRHSLNYSFYRKFYSTYNIFQQKGNIQEELAYTAATETKNTGKGWKISVICWFYFTALKTRHAAGISSKRKGRDWNKTTHNEYQHQWESLADSPNKKSPPPSGNCTCSFIKYTISFFLFFFFYFNFFFFFFTKSTACYPLVSMPSLLKGSPLFCSISSILRKFYL